MPTPGGLTAISRRQQHEQLTFLREISSFIQWAAFPAARRFQLEKRSSLKMTSENDCCWTRPISTRWVLRCFAEIQNTDLHHDQQQRHDKTCCDGPMFIMQLGVDLSAPSSSFGPFSLDALQLSILQFVVTAVCISKMVNRRQRGGTSVGAPLEIVRTYPPRLSYV